MVSLERLNIAFIAGTLGQGGAERQLFYMLRTLKEQGTRLRLLSLTQGEFWQEKIEDLNVPVIWVGAKRWRLQRLWAIVQILRQDKPDIIQSQHGYANLYAALAARWLRVKDIGAVRTDALREIRTVGLMGHLNLRIPRLLAVNSTSGMNNSLKLGAAAERLHLLPNVIDTANFSPLERPLRQPVTLIWVGRLVHEKRADRFLHLLAQLRQQTSTPIRGLVVGNGPLRGELQAQAEALGLLSEGVAFLGDIADMRPIYHQADILVLTSDSEGMPNVIIEAMATSLPVVATSVGGVAEIVQDNITGFLFPSADDSAMLKILCRLVEDHPLRKEIGFRASQYIQRHHAMEHLVTFLSELYAKSFNHHQ